MEQTKNTEYMLQHDNTDEAGTPSQHGSQTTDVTSKKH